MAVRPECSGRTLAERGLAQGPWTGIASKEVPFAVSVPVLPLSKAGGSPEVFGFGGFDGRKILFLTFVLNFRFGRKLSIIRGIVEQEIQAMVSKRENVATHHLYQAWDPVPSLSPATTGTCGRTGHSSLGRNENVPEILKRGLRY